MKKRTYESINIFLSWQKINILLDIIYKCLDGKALSLKHGVKYIETSPGW